MMSEGLKIERLDHYYLAFSLAFRAPPNGPVVEIGRAHV